MAEKRVVSRLLLAALLCCALAGAGMAAEAPKDTPNGSDSPDVRPSPVDLARQATDKVFAILRDPEFQGDLNVQKRYDAVREEANKHFDWRQMAQRSLGPHWRRRTEAEREEFTELFSALIANTYMSTVERNLDAGISYKGEKIEEEFAMVKTMAVTTKGTEVPIVYWLRTADVPSEPPATGTRKSWLVYDVQIEGVSMVRNYRSQFNDVIVGSSYERLVQRLRAKVGGAAEERADTVAAAEAKAKKKAEAAGEDAQ